jgi:hypothetical protein
MLEVEWAENSDVGSFFFFLKGARNERNEQSESRHAKNENKENNASG